MNASELRIGNWVHHNGNYCYRCPSDAFDFQWNETDWYQVGEHCMNLEDISGIPLTEEKLKRLGLVICTEKHRRRYYKLPSDEKYYFVWNSISNSITAVGIGQPDSENIYMFAWKIKYVHNLQNLIFDLTGEELTIKK